LELIFLNLRNDEKNKEISKKDRNGFFACVYFSLKKPKEKIQNSKIMSSRLEELKRKRTSVIFDCTDKEKKLKHTISGINCIHEIALSPDKKLLAIGSDLPYLLVIDFATKKEKYRLCIPEHKPFYKDDENCIISTTFSPDGKYLAGGDRNGVVRIWDAIQSDEKEPKLIWETLAHKKRVANLSFSSDSKYLASCSYDMCICTWKMQDLDPDKRTTLFALAKTPIMCVAFSPDTKQHQFAVGSYDGTLRIKAIDIPCLYDSFDVPTKSPYKPDGVYCIAYSSDGCNIACGVGISVCIFNKLSGKFEKELKGHTSYIARVAYSPNNKYIASCGGDSTVRVWEIESGVCLKTFEHSNWVNTVLFLDDANVLSADYTGYVYLHQL